MSMNSELKARLERLAPVRVESRRPLSSDAAETVLLRLERTGSGLIPVMHLLRDAGLTLRQAHAAINELAAQRVAVCGLARGHDFAALADALAAHGVSLARRPIEASGGAWIGAVRERHGLSQRDFAGRLGVDVRTLQNWEQGRNRPDAAVVTLVRLFDRDPGAVMAAAYEKLSQ